MSLVASWRTALRVAHREARRSKGRSSLVVAMIALPVLFLSFAAVSFDMFSLTGGERADRTMGTADARIQWQFRAPVEQEPEDPDRRAAQAERVGGAGGLLPHPDDPDELVQPVGEADERAEEEGPAGGEEGEQERRSPCKDGGKGRVQRTRAQHDGRRRRAAALGAPGLGRPEKLESLLGRRPLAGVDREHPVDRPAELAREVRPQLGERLRALLDAPSRLEGRGGPEGMTAGERLPEEHADGPDVRRSGRLVAGQTLGSDVGKRARDVSDGGERIGVVDLGEPEVEEAHGDRVAPPRSA